MNNIEYYGQELTEEEMECRFLTRFIYKQDILEKEVLCARRRWKEYQGISPMRATYIFAHYYKEEYRRHYKKYYDADASSYVKGSKFDDFNESKEAVGFFKARRIADMLGCPYWFYIRYAMETIDGSGTKFLPRPNMLYGERPVLRVQDKFREYLKEDLL